MPGAAVARAERRAAHPAGGDRRPGPGRGGRAVRVTELPRALLALGGLVSPVLRELPEVAYQTEAPFIMDSTAAQAAFGLAPQPWDEVLAQTVAAYAGRSRPRSRTTGMKSSR